MSGSKAIRRKYIVNEVSQCLKLFAVLESLMTIIANMVAQTSKLLF